MRILIVTNVFKPEMGALANRLYPIVRQMAADGHKVFVATGMPNYPKGVVFPEYVGKRTMSEDIEGATVLRTSYHVAPRNQSKLRMLLSYGTMMPALYRSGRRAGKVDVVYVTSPPLFSAIPAMWLAKWSNAKLVVELRDLWPDEFISVGAAKEGSRIVKWVRKIEREAYRRATLVVCTTNAFSDTVVERGVKRENTVLIPNGADIEVFRPLPSRNKAAEALQVGEKFVVMYSGLLGLKFGLDMLLDVAAILKPHDDIVMVIRGEGPKKADLVERVAKDGLTNVVFGGEVPFPDVPYMVARADVCVTCLPPDDYLEKIISVKIFEYLACEKPVVASLRGEGARVITEGKGGLVVAPGDAQAMSNAILELKGDPERRREMGASGRQYVLENYSRGVIAQRLSKCIGSLQ